MRRTMTFVFAVCAAISTASVTRADEEEHVEGKASDEGEPRGKPPGGLELGGRTGFGIPLGTIFNNAVSGSSVNMSDFFVGQVPLWVDAGYRAPHFFVGLFTSFGVLILQNNSTTGCGQASTSSCSGNDAVVGGEVQYHFAPESTLDAWMGAGFGYEWANLYQTIGGTDEHAEFDGWQFFDVQLGADYAIQRNVGIGPFAALAFGQYSNASVSAGGMNVSGSVKNQALHEWLTLGLRVDFDLAFDH